ncbi:MAG: iron-sulfur cluster assembly accessory protein [Polyangiaceae bacterium]|nr:iron-sulfur cluster assembly accessory protein [Polyangiaceae bacterium]
MNAEPQNTPQAPVESQAKAKLDIGISQPAVEAIKTQIKKRGKENTSLRVGIRGGGCSGFSYVIEFHDGPPHARDRVYDLTAADGTPVRVVVDPKSLVYLNGAVLEWEDKLVRRGFKWSNPQEKTNCGCGHSFTV